MRRGHAARAAGKLLDVSRRTTRAPCQSFSRMTSQVAAFKAAHPSPTYNPSATEAVFRCKSLGQLVFEAALFKLCSYPAMVRLASSTLQADVPLISPLARALARQTVFKHFVSGESMRDCLSVSRRLFEQTRVTCILDHNVEEKETEDAWDLNLKNKLALFSDLEKENQQHCVKFVPLKCTALLSPTLLENMTRIMAGSDSSDVTAALSENDKRLLETGYKRLEALCAAAQKCGLAILLDAEQSFRQPAIEVIAQRLSAQFNQGGRILIYNTYQCYLKRTTSAIERDSKLAEERGYTFAVKLVRGAYMKTERARALERGTPDPVHSKKADTDASYNGALTFLLQRVSLNKAAVLVATHSRQSVDHCVEEMRALAIAPSNKRIDFGSILGMSDNLSNALGLAGYNSNKLVSFGIFEDVVPWLCRRLDENNDLFGAMQGERHLLAKEIKRRILG